LEAIALFDPIITVVLCLVFTLRALTLIGFPFISYSNARKKGQFLHFPIENRRKRGKKPTLHYA